MIQYNTIQYNTIQSLYLYTTILENLQFVGSCNIKSKYESFKILKISESKYEY